MKIMSVNTARAIWLVPLTFLNPRGRFIAPAVQSVASRYHFLKVPDVAAAVAQPLGLKFEGGAFSKDGKVPITVNLSIHDDGLIGDTRSSTEDSERFLDDMLSWFCSEYDLPGYQGLEIQKMYLSELIVQLDKPFADIFKKAFEPFLSLLSERGLSNNPGTPLELSALHFAPDSAAVKQAYPFRLERLINAPFERAQYYTSAPIPTSDHIKLLQRFEACLS